MRSAHRPRLIAIGAIALLLGCTSSPPSESRPAADRAPTAATPPPPEAPPPRPPSDPPPAPTPATPTPPPERTTPPERPTPPGPPPRRPKPPERRADRDTAAASIDLHACTTDADCIIYCPAVRGCCGFPCGCTNAINRNARAAAVAEHQRTCRRAPNCPAVGCIHRDAHSARCNAGRCVANLDSPLGP
jgi:hypothetical protein